MQPREPSRTAQRAAAHRAAHQVLEGGALFADPLAGAILGRTLQDLAREAAADPGARAMRLFIAARSRFCEDAIAAAVARGVRQVVVLGAGLDTFALRNPYAGVRVFEVDHPATQAFKRRRLAAAGLDAPPTLTFAPVDFEREGLADGLQRAGMRVDQPAFFSWLGVVPYLSPEAFGATLRVIAGVPGAEVVFDYAVPLEHLEPGRRARAETLGARVAAAGEPWVTRLDPEEVAARLRALGFIEIEDLGPAALRRHLRPAAPAGEASPPEGDAPEGDAPGSPAEGPHVTRARRP